MADRVHRITMFKVPDPAEQKVLCSQYETLFASQTKDGKPYILSVIAGPALADERSQGFTVIAKTEFASLDDMRYYDNECPAHAALKDFAKGLKHEAKPTSVYFQPQVVNLA